MWGSFVEGVKARDPRISDAIQTERRSPCFIMPFIDFDACTGLLLASLPHTTWGWGS